MDEDSKEGSDKDSNDSEDSGSEDDNKNEVNEALRAEVRSALGNAAMEDDEVSYLLADI